MPSGVGRVVGGRWEIERQLARGGMGIVWVARHRITRQLAALKVLYPDGPRQDELHERLLREAAAPAQIGHPGLVRVYDAGVDPSDGSMYIAMELLQGESLRDRFARPGLTTQTALQLVVELLEPLAAAHALGFVHRDLKPQNAFLAREADGTERVKLLDFGLSRAPGVRTVTNANNLMGTAIYTAPEQLRSARTVGPQADVWSVGVTLYQILAGKLPFEGQTVALFGKILTETPPPLPSIAPAVAPALATLVERCLEKDPQARPADASVLRRELVAAMGPSLQPLPGDAPVVAEMATDPMAPMPMPAPEPEPEPEPKVEPEPKPEPEPESEAEAEAELETQVALPPSASPKAAAPAPAKPAGQDGPPALGILGAPVPILSGDSAVTKRRMLASPNAFPLVIAASVLIGAGVVIAIYAALRSGDTDGPAPSASSSPARVLAAAEPLPIVRPPAAPDPPGAANQAPDAPLIEDTTADGEPPGPEDADRTDEARAPDRGRARSRPSDGAPAHLDEPERPWPERLPSGSAAARQQQQAQQTGGPLPGNARDCGPITNSTAAHCFIAATGGNATGEYMQRNLILAYTLVGDRGRARSIARRYFETYGSSPFARQIEQLGYSP